jgi:hypothetical protein
MNLTVDDIRVIETLRASLPGVASDAAVELASQFNANLDAILKRLEEYLSPAPVPLLGCDIESLRDLVTEREETALTLQQDIIALIDQRRTLLDRIVAEMDSAKAKSADALARLKDASTSQLESLGLAGDDLKQSVDRLEPVRAATVAHKQLGDVGPDFQRNCSAEHIAWLRARFVSSLEAWIRTFCNIPTPPAVKAPEPPQASWRHEEFPATPTNDRD